MGERWCTGVCERLQAPCWVSLTDFRWYFCLVTSLDGVCRNYLESVSVGGSVFQLIGERMEIARILQI